ncbi:GGDEF domain-containing protein [Thiopseudomonas denitrificans]|uniref:Diguanylate cyclase (GGDEF)-like protein n=1 Tax=Thiopseudomonas denitrificans TaxID=1501432 RepID=A0A4R6TWK9_9GAMM|nr:GGDEF domain-containing protein [Thiopseudomonas denitrificans]TDQ37851.1 diguanylate cyclase (GGDEF)-like protein [Thiopseudomonas denitrificans]
MKKPITRSSTLFRQFVLSLTFPVLLAFMLAGLGTVWITWSQQQSDLALQKESMLQSYREALVKPLWDCDNNTVEGILVAMMYQTGIAWVQINEACREQILQAGDAQLADNPDSVEVFTLEYLDEKGRGFYVGTLEVLFKSQSIQTGLADNFWRYLMLLAALLASMLCITLLIFRRLISNPLQRFQIIIEQNKNRTDSPLVSAGAAATQDNELGQVMHAYDDLMQELYDVITQLKQQQATLHDMAHTDSLTGLGNRLRLEDVLTRALARSHRSGQAGCVFLLDLNDFKPVNDTWGHAAGDVVLQQVGERLHELLRDTDVAVRLGGDEFVVVAEEAGDRSAVTHLAEKIRQRIEQPYAFRDQQLQVGVSIGYALFPDDGESSTALLARADQVMYREKRNR